MSKIYDAIVTTVSGMLPSVGIFNSSVADFVEGRKNQTYPTTLISPVWIHCASLGEFEQGRPLIEAIKKEWPDQHMVLTFFSKSGYDIRKSYPLADWIGYMPIDTKREAEKFINAIRPRLAIFVKYEFWYNHLDQLSLNHIPFIFISTNFFKGHYLLQYWNRWLLDKVLKASAFFVQDESSKNILNSLGYKNGIVTGDTRVDRVLDLLSGIHPLEYFDSNTQCQPILVAGSTWPADEFVLKDFLKYLEWRKNKDSTAGTYRFIMAPHNPSASRVAELTNLYAEYNPILYSNWRGEPFKVLIVDSIGILNRLYGYAQVAYVGGGFGRGIHNILEPAVYGIPVFFGPKHSSFAEAGNLIKRGVAFSIQNVSELKSIWNVQIPQNLPVIKSNASKFFADNNGAT
ncbi:MAG: glycosyltransferase N-terminal domain-containing protein, partial [Saprospiraceae bacterium]